ncbi:MAG: HEAT repeat domain-containing protein [Cyanobacteria bacterium J06621_11]
MSLRARAVNSTGTSAEGMTVESLNAEPTTSAQVDGDHHDWRIDAQVDQAIAQLLAGDFHSQWAQSKQLAKKFAGWGDRSIPALLRQLKSQSDPDIQWFLVRILSGFRHPSIVEALAQLLVATPNEQLQAEIIKALAGFGESAIAHLSALLSAMPSGATPSSGPTKHESTDEAVNLAVNLAVPEQRLLAARVLARIRRSCTIEPLLSIAADPDPALREIAIEALGSFHDARITPFLLAALEDEPAICVEAIRTLGRRSDLLPAVDLIVPLQSCLQSSHEAIACESAVALGRLGHQRAITALGEQLSAPLAIPVKVAIVQALGWLNVPDAIAHLTQAFAYDVPVIMPVVQQALAKALGQTRDLSLKAMAARPLIDWLSASLASASLASASAAPDIDPVPTTDNAGERDYAMRADFALMQSTLTALTRLAVPDSLDCLILALSYPDPRIRMHALNALRQIDPDAAQIKIQRYLHSDMLSPVAKQYVSETLAAW